MTQHHPPHHEAEASHTTDIHDHDPIKEYLKVWAALMVLLVITVLAAQIAIPEPWSFVVALIIASIKATLVILFFMHVKDASRVTWVFCGCSFLWLAIMLGLTFADYMTRVPVSAETPLVHSDAGPAPANKGH